MKCLYVPSCFINSRCVPCCATRLSSTTRIQSAFGGKAMGNGYDGLAPHQREEGRLDFALILLGHAGGRLVEYDDGASSAGVGRWRCAASRRRRAWTTLAHHRVVPLRQSHDKVMAAGRLRRGEEGALIEMYLAGVSVRRVEDITEALWSGNVSYLPPPSVS